MRRGIDVSTRELAHPIEARSAVATARRRGRDARDGVGATELGSSGRRRRAEENATATTVEEKEFILVLQSKVRD